MRAGGKREWLVGVFAPLGGKALPKMRSQGVASTESVNCAQRSTLPRTIYPLPSDEAWIPQQQTACHVIPLACTWVQARLPPLCTQREQDLAQRERHIWAEEPRQPRTPCPLVLPPPSASCWTDPSTDRQQSETYLLRPFALSLRMGAYVQNHIPVCSLLQALFARICLEN